MFLLNVSGGCLDLSHFGFFCVVVLCAKSYAHASLVSVVTVACEYECRILIAYFSGFEILLDLPSGWHA